MLHKELRQIECGFLSPRQQEVVSKHTAAVNSLAVDSSESRYLLSGGGDGKVKLYDTARVARKSSRSGNDGSNQKGGEGKAAKVGRYSVRRLEPIFESKWGRGHGFSVSWVEWYPFDTGLFVTGGMDCKVLVWDTNTLQAVQSFGFQHKVNCCVLSPVASAHSLVATATDGYHLRLCDMASGGVAHTLLGHTDQIWAVAWSPLNEWQLASGSVDRTVRVWDVRRAGCVMVLDPENLHDVRTNRRFVSREDSLRVEAFRSHGDSVTHLRYTCDGRYLLSSGMDRRLRLWHAASGKNTWVHYPDTRNRNKLCRFAASPDGSTVYYPSGLKLLSFDVEKGDKLQELTGHLDQVQCVACNPMANRTTACQVFSGGKDQQILAWTPLPGRMPGTAPTSRHRRMARDAGDVDEGAALDYNPFDADADMHFAGLGQAIERAGGDADSGDGGGVGGGLGMDEAPSTDEEDEWSDYY